MTNPSYDLNLDRSTNAHLGEKYCASINCVECGHELCEHALYDTLDENEDGLPCSPRYRHVSCPSSDVEMVAEGRAA